MRQNLKAFATGILVSALAVGMVASVSAAFGWQTVEVDYSDIKVVMDGKPVNMVDANGNPVEPFAINGTTYLPIRAISAALGLDVGWDGETKSVTLDKPEGQRTIYMTATGKRYHVNPTCNGGTYYPVPLQSAIDMGLTPCDKCVLKAGE